MAESKNESINLLDLALGVAEEQEPVEITTGTWDLKIRRHHSGAQIADWQRRALQNNVDIDAATNAIAEDGNLLPAADRTDNINALGKEYFRWYLGWISVEATEEALDGITDEITSLPFNAMKKVKRHIDQLAGLVDEKGQSIPFPES